MVNMRPTPPPEGSYGPDDARLKRYEHRTAQMLSSGRAVGWLATGVSTRFEEKGRWPRKEVTRTDALTWQVTWSDPSRFDNGYNDISGDALGTEDVTETLRDWDAGKHELAGEWFELRWLSGDEASDAWANYGWDG
jgi:hypothetical protein